ncbi:MAG: hydroxymethylglutaryl-CoA lyase [Rhodospirillaceae bacterium]|nr:hydroxymethylglutaryl-CoA lyase [Rhodospirillaceae bacterium]
MNGQAIVNEVGPRDGLQSQSRILSVDERMQLIGALEASGIRRIEVGSFASPKAVPAMAGTDRLLERLSGEGRTTYTSMVPNLKGYRLAREAGTTSVTVIAYATETMAQRNVRMTLAETEHAASDILRLARDDGVEAIVIVAVAFGCPFEGAVDPGFVRDLAARYLEADVARLVLADTIGTADPAQVGRLSSGLVEGHGAARLGCHFHDTRAMGLANVYAALQAGIRWFDSSIGGLGGCPFAPGASGNVATEDVVMMLHQMGFETGIDLSKLLEASDLATRLTGTAPGGRAREWLRKRLAASERDPSAALEARA